MKLFKIFSAAALAMVGVTAGAEEAPLWLRNAAISPDGKTIAFTYMGDIFTVPKDGGAATRITSQPSYETSPIWSPDSKTIAFASDRCGNFDIYVVDAQGGTPRRLTTHSASETPMAFTPDGREIYYSAYIQAPAASAQFPTPRLTQVYARKVDGSDAPRQVIGTPAQAISFIPGTKGSFVYQDVKGGENAWRKHHTSSITRDICMYDAVTGRHTNLTARPGEDRNPVVSSDGKNVTYLAERDGGAFNVYRAPITDMAHPTALTNFKTHPVRSLSQAGNGTLAFTWNGELYTLAPGATKPVKVAVEMTFDRPDQTEWLALKAAGGVPSPNGEQLAFVNRGDIFVTSVEHSSVKQVTATAAAESDPTWAADGRTIAYTSRRDKDGRLNIYTATIDLESDPNFSNATTLTEKPLVKANDGVERSYPQYSPDGKQIAFVQDRNKLMVMDTESGKVRQLTDGSTYPYRDGGEFEYQWSPDSKWIVLEVDNNHHSPYTDIALIEVATGRLTNLTRTGYTDRRPAFAMGGNAIVFLSERYGMRNHASWGSLDDVMVIFLNRDAFDRYRLSEEDYALRKEVEKANKKKGDKDKDKDKEKVGDSNDKSKDIVVELDGIEDRTVRLTPSSSQLSGAWIDAEGETLYYLSSTGGDYDLWKMDLRKREPKQAARLAGNKGGSLVASADGKTLWVCGPKITKVDVKSDKTTGITVKGSMRLDHAAEREAMFNEVVVNEREMFYDKKMHGVHWDDLAANYRRFLPHINNNYDFAEMLSELLGELNVSHTGATYRGSEATEAVDRTAALGLLYDLTYTGNGMRVAEILPDGPFGRFATTLSPGAVITAINGEKITPATDISLMLNNLRGKKTLVEFTPAAGGDAVTEVVLPISTGEETAMLYDRWVKGRAAYVDSISGGRLGYVHIKSMDDASFRKVYADALGKYNDREGLVIDIRWNGGGRLHEDIEVLFSGDKYFTQVIRGTEICDMPSRRYNKPTVMVMGEACYSNAHGTPWVYKNRGLGKLVGMPVPGTMTSVNWINLQDHSITYGVPVVGYRLPDGSYLENTQLEPDILVENDPATIVLGEDLQLRAAVESLLNDLSK